MNELLLEKAKEALENAYAVYSHFAVGAALECSDGRIFLGCNVENLSFGLTLCAERVAVCNAVTAGCRDFQRILIVSDSSQPISPCGACRQCLAEFAPDLEVLSATLDGQVFQCTLSQLLPRPKEGILECRNVPRGTPSSASDS